MLCPNCRAQLSPNAVFCDQCGKPVVATPPPATQPAQDAQKNEKKPEVLTLVLSVVGFVFSFFNPTVAYVISGTTLAFAIARRNVRDTLPALVMCIFGLAIVLIQFFIGNFR
ncbi:MAG: zinc ribbon domain-containing protein [Dehalococcoidia bacterium]|nr:zinc ribbon domain-containing protein [Dehalococcoidia bacterium]